MRRWGGNAWQKGGEDSVIWHAFPKPFSSPGTLMTAAAGYEGKIRHRYKTGPQHPGSPVCCLYRVEQRGRVTA